MSNQYSAISVYLAFLGQPMKDKVTGISGMLDSVCFDAYGCIQGSLRGKANKDGSLPDGRWFDMKRLVEDGKRIMEAPSYAATVAGRENGPAEKPRFSSPPSRD